jgi:hypothetical protein
MEEIREQLSKKWQMKSLCNLVGQLLHYDNPFVLRSRGLDMLLMLLDLLGDNADATLVQLLSIAVNFAPFCDRTHDARLLSQLQSRMQTGSPTFLIESSCLSCHLKWVFFSCHELDGRQRS